MLGNKNCVDKLERRFLKRRSTPMFFSALEQTEITWGEHERVCSMMSPRCLCVRTRGTGFRLTKIWKESGAIRFRRIIIIAVDVFSGLTVSNAFVNHEERQSAASCNSLASSRGQVSITYRDVSSAKRFTEDPFGAAWLMQLAERGFFLSIKQINS